MEVEFFELHLEILELNPQPPILHQIFVVGSPPIYLSLLQLRPI
ncbi:hypothetical protein SLEP1_g47029 [Rubroshorea leprosula]|uniref:Uncharacterized protein n=1 Tax=Rubroshorea leprosula TaxID=152421 RepID=A0AAV5LPX4_9ROSI|nr:hypothetical protein SLEP1_g47029 [Rubroshorea leprosula]